MKNTEKVLAALLSSDTQVEAAEKCGLSDRQLRNYLADQNFSAEYQRRKTALVTDATRQLQSSYQTAIRALRDIVEDEASGAAARISAARALLDTGLRFTEISDIMTRLEALERTQNNDGH